MDEDNTACLTIFRGVDGAGDAELIENIRELQGIERLVDDETHGPFGIMDTEINDGFGEAWIAHARHGDQELACK